MTATDGPIGWLTQPPRDIASATPMAAVLTLSPQPLFNFDAARGSCLMGSAPFHCHPNLPFAACSQSRQYIRLSKLFLPAQRNAFGYDQIKTNAPTASK